MSAAAANPSEGVLLRFAAATQVVLPSGAREVFKPGVQSVDAALAEQLVADGDAHLVEEAGQKPAESAAQKPAKKGGAK